MSVLNGTSVALAVSTASVVSPSLAHEITVEIQLGSTNHKTDAAT